MENKNNFFQLFQIKNLKKNMNYSCNIINEYRLSNDDIKYVFYPHENQYIDKNQKIIKLPFFVEDENNYISKIFFLEKLREQQIIYSIRYLQISCLKKIISKNFSSRNMKNPFKILLSTFFPIEKNIDATKKIIDILINNYDKNLDLIKNLNYFKNEKNKILFDIFDSIIKDDINNLCYLCLTTYPKNLLINNICQCKNPVHTECMIKLNNFKKISNCSICKSKYEINFFKNILYFPHNDFYPNINNKLIKVVDKTAKLKYAIIFKETQRIKILLEDSNDLNNDFGYGQNVLIFLIDLIFQSIINENCIFPQDYLEILDIIIATKKVDFFKKDISNKSCFFYISKIKNYSPLISSIIYIKINAAITESFYQNLESNFYLRNSIEDWLKIISFISEKPTNYKCNSCSTYWTKKNMIIFNEYCYICPICDININPFLYNPRIKKNLLKYISIKHINILFSDDKIICDKCFRYNENFCDFCLSSLCNNCSYNNYINYKNCLTCKKRLCDPDKDFYPNNFCKKCKC